MATNLGASSGVDQRQLRQRLFTGSFWMVAMRLAIRGIGLVSTIILARLLSPADFGIVAMAMLVIGFVEIVLEADQQLALIQHPNPGREHYDTAWTMTAIINTAVTLLVIGLAPFTPLYFHDERIVLVIQILSLKIFLPGFFNIGVVDFRRELNFSKEFRFLVLRKLLSFCATMILALTLRTYWALVIGIALGNVLEVALSYVVHPYRPRLTLSKVRELSGYSMWLLLQALGAYFEQKVDGFIVAGMASSANMGRYVVGLELGELPTTELLDPIERALFPNYSRLKDDVELFRETYLQALGVAVAICAAIGTGIIVTARDLVAVILGPQWIDIAPMVKYFAAAGAIFGVCKTVFPVLNALGNTRASAFQTWLRAAFHIPAMLWAAQTGDFLNFAIAKPVIAIVLLPTYFMSLRRVLPITWAMIGAVSWRPPCAAVIMALVVKSIDFNFITSPFGRLPLEILVGGAVFISSQLLFWTLAGRPAGLERDLILSPLLRGSYCKS